MSTFGTQIQAIEQGLLNSVTNATQLQVAMNKLQSMDVSLMSEDDLRAYQKAIEKVDQLRKALKDASEQGQKNLEALRKRLETVTDRTKKWAEELVKAGGLSGKLAGGILQASHAAGELSKSGDIGRFIQQLTSGIPIVAQMGFVLGETVSATIKAQDSLKVINKTFIDAAGSVGVFAQGMGVAATSSESLGQGLAIYEQQTGLTRDQTLGLVTALSKAGFAMEEMGVNEQTGHIKTFEEAVSGLSDSFGALSSTVAMARSSGMDMSQVTEQMGFQTKFLGQSIEQTTKTFAGLQVASERSKLSTQILLPIVRSIQEQYKFLGIRSDDAALSVGRMAQAARKAGLGPQAGAQLFGRAMGGLIGAGFGTQAFLGMQMGMGPGLGAGIRFRREAGESGAKTAVGVAGAVQNIIGGKFVSQEDAMRPGNEILAGIRVAQEQLVMQLTGLSQLEASGFLDTAEQLKKLEADGKGETDEAKEARKKLEAQMMSENQYRAQTLTAQQKMALLMEVMTKTLVKLLMSFVKGFAGEAGKGEEAFAEIFKAIEEGKGLDVISEKATAFAITLEKDLSPAANKVGKWLGELTNKLGGKGLTGVLTTVLGLGLGVKILQSGKAMHTLGSIAGSVGRAVGSLGGVVLGNIGTLAKLGGAAGVAAAAGVAIGTLARQINIGGKSFGEHVNGWADSLVTSIDAVEAMAAAHNKEAVATYARIGKLGEKSGFETGEEAIEYLEKFGMDQLTKERGHIAAQAALEQARELTALKVKDQREAAEEARKTLRHGEKGYTPIIGGLQMLFGPSEKERIEAATKESQASITAEAWQKRIQKFEESAKINRPGVQRETINRVFDKTQPTNAAPVVGSPATPQSSEVTIYVRGEGDVLAPIVDKRVKFNIKNGLLQPGPEAASRTGHGLDNTGY